MSIQGIAESVVEEAAGFGPAGGGKYFCGKRTPCGAGVKDGFLLPAFAGTSFAGMTPNQIRQGIGPIGTGQAVGGLGNRCKKGRIRGFVPWRRNRQKIFFGHIEAASFYQGES
jgi:hypothetical protein